MADLTGDVDRGAAGLKRIQVASKVGPRGLERGARASHAVVELVPRHADQRRAEAHAAVAHQLQRDALGELAVGEGIDQEGGVRVSVQVDEAGRHRLAGGVDHRPRFGLDAADGGDPVAFDGHVGLKSGRAGPIDHPSVLDQNVEHGSSPSLAHNIPTPTGTPGWAGWRSGSCGS